jgi:hypothetical protein
MTKTTYARATLEYDRDHERALMEAVTLHRIEGARLQCGRHPNR